MEDLSGTKSFVPVGSSAIVSAPSMRLPVTACRVSQGPLVSVAVAGLKPNASTPMPRVRT